MKTWSRWMIPAIYAGILAAGLAFRHELLDWLQQNRSLPLMTLLAALLALIPIVPYKAVIALLGYAYGPVWASIVTWLGTTAAACIVYFGVRTLYRESGRRLLGKYKMLHAFTEAVERHPFRAVFLARLLPIIPQMGVNLYAGVASVPFWTFTAASALGKIPAIVLYAWLGSGLADRPLLFALLAAAIMLAAASGLVLYRYMKRRRANV
ncbi:TVP38/TMEM64 family protein [Paenibacillus sp. FSL K6-1566]|uniref:TVP38/TMEM64 family membrane protein n=1 Tax=Paenibacillus lactis TaxID=228574 RepID=A0ABS4FL81_9BACL|nr:TVP38/TMEM64 family protein [Paenibacillus lactis]MBP1897009.1 putative membrane protein YdjX (TVP38/TMEM64 family) [Paenibacillus lactis]